MRWSRDRRVGGRGRATEMSPWRKLGAWAGWPRGRAGNGTPPPVEKVVRFVRRVKNADRERSAIRMPSYEQVAADPVLYAHASRILHLEANPGNARALTQRHGDID